MPMLIQAWAIPAHILFNYLMTMAFGEFSIVSNAIATDITYIFSFTLTMLWLAFSNDPIR
jgi:Na+-driven multidrug efflux pump